MQREKTYHLSVDDVFVSLAEVVDRDIGLFDHPVFTFLQSIHERFGIDIDLYLFGEGEASGHRRTLGDLAGQLHDELCEVPWIHFGPHALNYETRPYDQTLEELIMTFDSIYEQIDWLSGKTARSRCLRLHYFSECFEAIPYLRSKGIEVLYLTDRPAVSYNLPATQTTLLQESGAVVVDGMSLQRSFPRIESLVTLDLSNLKLATMLRDYVQLYGYVALFTHEINLADAKVRDLIFRCLLQLENLGAKPI